jgi:hypothetical protein
VQRGPVEARLPRCQRPKKTRRSGVRDPFEGEQARCYVPGHSLWFKKFFDRYLPTKSTHISKKKKMKNCAAVAFDFYVDDNGSMYIDEYSIAALHLGFSK